jgi:putative nucleotidyltransferase with HDIG domain
VKLGAGSDSARPHGAAHRNSLLFGFLLVAGFIAALEILFPQAVPTSENEIKVGQVSREEVVAPFDFDVLKTADELEQERKMAANGVVPVFRYDEASRTENRTHFGELLTRIYDIRTGSEPSRQRLEMLGQLGVTLSDASRRILLDAAQAERVEERAREIMFALYDRGVLSERGTPPLKPDDTVMLIKGDDETMVRIQSFIPERLVVESVQREAAKTLNDPDMTIAVKEIVTPFLEGNVVYDVRENRQRKEAARAAVVESTGRDFKKDEVVLQRGERITGDHVVAILSLESKRAELLMQEAGCLRFFPHLGRILEAMLLLGLFALYVMACKRRMITEIRYPILFMILVTMVMAGAAIVGRIPDAPSYLVPVAVLAMFASMLFDFETAVIATVVTVILVAVYTSFGLPFIFVSLTAGMVAAYSVRRVRHREDFYWSGIKIVGAYALAIAIADVSMVDVGIPTLTRMGWGGLNALVSMGIVIVALPLFERGFKVTTDITLLELGDMNRPLLRRMAMTAPGTYHHSIVVGNLAEAAADAIGANGLLARVGAYYHDIGKLVNPGYFVENQQGLDQTQSKHAGLKPKVSSIIIQAHVKDGVELARKEKLPEPIVDMVREHHGTSVMEFFYKRAAEESEDPSEVSEGEYSYPGPRPRSKESAIVMLADLLEARTRSIGESPTPKRIEAEIDDAIEKRWRTHQLDDAELTLSDLRKIREAFFRVLIGMYHQRVKYPDQKVGESGETTGEATDAGDAGDPGGAGKADDSGNRRGAGKADDSEDG